MTLRIAIADDEPLARRRLRGLLQRDPDVALVAECRDGPETVEALRAGRPDIVFLDIEMPGLDGMAIIEAMSPEDRPHTVLVTAHDRYAVRAFDVRAVDYLLKPYDDERFATALERAKAAARQRTPQRLLSVRGARGTTLVAIDEIDWIESADNYVQVHAGGACHLVRATLAELEQRLAGGDFVRVHRCVIVRLPLVHAVQRTPHGDLRIALPGGATVPVGRTYRAALERRLGVEL